MTENSLERPEGPSGGPNCYFCLYRSDVLYSAHSSCIHPLIRKLGASEAKKRLEIQGAEKGIREGWFLWPYNFDPIWLERCQGFRELPKQKKADDSKRKED